MMTPRKRILVIDDESKIRLLLRELLEFHDYEVVTAASGQEALDYLKGQLVHLILLDLRMPVMDGWQVLRQLKDREQTRSIPTIMLTSESETRAVLTSEDLRATDYFIKPFKANELLAFIQRYLEHRIGSPLLGKSGSGAKGTS